MLWPQVRACLTVCCWKMNKCWCWASPVAWRKCLRGCVMKSADCQWMDGRKESKWCGWHRDLVVVAGVWAVVSTHTPLLLFHSLIGSCIGGAECVVDRVIGWRSVVWVE